MRSRRASHSRELIAAIVDEAARNLVENVRLEIEMDLNRVRGFLRTKDVKTLYKLESSLSKAKDDLRELKFVMAEGASV